MQNSIIHNQQSILISGIGSGSLGMELLKCLELEKNLNVFGTDVNRLASGLNDTRFKKTFIIESGDGMAFVEETIDICKAFGVSFIVPGAEATNKLISLYQECFKQTGITPLVNSKEVYDICSDKTQCNDFLRLNGLPFLETKLLRAGEKLSSFPIFPAVVKPATQSGGSNLVFLAENIDEAAFFTRYLGARGFASCVQEYVVGDDEFTVGVMSSPSKDLLSCIALRRNLSSKLSRMCAYGTRVLSSGWSQGRIEEFPEVCEQSIRIAKAIGSTWAINIQGRLKDGKFIPFEINPRHSGTSYFRALAGVNEICLGLHFLNNGTPRSYAIRSGEFSRVLEERYILDPIEEVR